MKSQTSAGCQEYIVDAEALGLAATDCLMLLDGGVAVGQRDRWHDVVNRISERYGFTLIPQIVEGSLVGLPDLNRMMAVLEYLRVTIKDPLDPEHLGKWVLETER